MEYILYTIGEKGDNFYLDINKAKWEKERRRALGDVDFVLKKLTYYEELNGIKNVIEVTYLDNKIDKVYYTFENDCSYVCYKMKAKGFKFKHSPELYTIVSNLFLWFAKMYPELNEVKVFKNLCKLESEANYFIKAIVESDGRYSIDEGVKKFGLNQELGACVRISYAKSCYLMGNIEEGDKYLQRVDLTLTTLSSSRVDAYFKEVLELRNIKVKNGKALVLTRFRKY